MRWLASALVALAMGCGGVVPLDSDGGGTAPSSCTPLVATGAPVGLAVRVAGMQTTVTEPPQYTCCPVAGAAGRFACTAAGSAASVTLGIAFPSGSAHGGAIRTDFVLERVAAPGGTDTSAWGGDMTLQSGGVTDPGGVVLDGYDEACSAAGSALHLRFARFTFRFACQ